MMGTGKNTPGQNKQRKEDSDGGKMCDFFFLLQNFCKKHNCAMKK